MCTATGGRAGARGRVRRVQRVAGSRGEVKGGSRGGRVKEEQRLAVHVLRHVRAHYDVLLWHGREAFRSGQ